MIGDSTVGKTSIITKYVANEFRYDQGSTTGLDFAVKQYEGKIEGYLFKGQIKLWDTVGQERFHTLTYAFYRRADGIILCFDITN